MDRDRVAGTDEQEQRDFERRIGKRETNRHKDEDRGRDMRTWIGTEGAIERQHPGQGEREMDREMDRDGNGGTYKQGLRQKDRNRESNG